MVRFLSINRSANTFHGSGLLSEYLDIYTSFLISLIMQLLSWSLFYKNYYIKASTATCFIKNYTHEIFCGILLENIFGGVYAIS